MKYKVGDKVRIVSERTGGFQSTGAMDHWLGQVMTIREVNEIDYRMVEDAGESGGWYWGEDMIAGLADEEEEILVHLTRTHIEDLLRWVEGLGGESITRLKEALAELDAPKIGDRCAFWDDNKNLYRIGVLTEMKSDYAFKYRKDNGTLWKNCAKIKKEAEF